MATKVQDKNELVLLDGTKIEVKPLKISLLKPFLNTFQGLVTVSDDNVKSMDVLLDCVQIAFKQFLPEMADDRKAIEENLDLPLVYAIVNTASGMDLGDKTDLLSTVTK